MSDHTRLRVLLPIALFAWIFFAAGCAQPLGPGFRLRDRGVEIRPETDAADRVHIQVTDRLDNNGDRTLRSLEVRLPEGPDSGTTNLRVTINGREVSYGQISPDAGSQLTEIPFDPAWQKLQTREVITRWDLLPGAASGQVAVAPGAPFYLADATGLPQWQAPKGLFTRGGPTPVKENLTVIVPKDFRVLASGTPNRHRAQGTLVVHQFLIKPKIDFPPYVIAGSYLEQSIEMPQGVVVFWTLQPLDPQVAKAAALRLASSFHAFTDYFGPATKGRTEIHIVEAPADLEAGLEVGVPGRFDGLAGGISFPNGVLLDRRNFGKGLGDEAVLELAEYGLSQTWFGWRVEPEMTVRTLMSRGAGIFSQVVAAETRDPAARRGMVASLLERYDQAKRAAPDTRLIEDPNGAPNGNSREERVTAGYKAGLFFVALEDLCGRDNLSLAFKTVLKYRAGNTVSQNDLRSALEAASHRDLAEVFRAWLNRPGIPDEFRVRYAGAGR